MFNKSSATGTGGSEPEVPVSNAKVLAAPKLRDSAKFSVVQIVSQNRTCRNPSPILREWMKQIFWPYSVLKSTNSTGKMVLYVLVPVAAR